MPVHNVGPSAQGAFKRISGQIDLSEIQNATVRKGYDLWESLRGARLFPSRAQMSPKALGPMLRNTVLVRVLDAGAEFQLRVIGDAIMIAQGDQFQGLTTAEVEKQLPRYGTVLHRTYSLVFTEKQPAAFRGTYHRAADGRIFHHENVLLPLGESDEAPDHILGVVVYRFSTR